MRCGEQIQRWQLMLALSVIGATSLAQRPRFPSTAPIPSTNLAPAQPPPNMVPVSPPTGSGVFPQQGYPQPGFQPPPSLNMQTFDPYAPQINTGSLLQSPSGSPSLSPPSIFSGNIFGGIGSTPASPSGYGTAPPTYGGPGLSNISSNPGYAPPELSYPASVYPNSTPPALFPNGVLGGSGVAQGNIGGFADAVGLPEAFRLIQGPRVRHTFISGGDGPDELGIDDTDVSVAVVLPNFLWSTQPLYILPSFGLHLWDGPVDPIRGLPGSAFDAFLAAGWQSDPNQIWGLELGIAAGVFSDFDAISSDSIRILGSALGKLRITPTATIKGGVMFVDRLRVGVIPAGGILWQPTPYSRFDIYFPNPKLSWYFASLGRHDVWAYAAGEFGGGSWTIKQANGVDSAVDINDLRLIGGFEWGLPELIRAGKRTAFIEAGYVFNRKLAYEDKTDHPLSEAFMFRAGVGY